RACCMHHSASTVQGRPRLSRRFSWQISRNGLSMSRLQILRYPDPRLYTVARPVTEVDDRIRQLADDMLETMYEADGVGLAATQVDVHERLIVIDTSEARDDPRVLINPEITARSEEMTFSDEGCLSVPQIYDKVKRH